MLDLSKNGCWGGTNIDRHRGLRVPAPGPVGAGTGRCRSPSDSFLYESYKKNV
jgi:hypothetical protein